MTVRLRNVAANLDDPVADWPFEAVLTVLERGGLSDWAKLAVEIDEHPWGGVSRKIEQAARVTDSYANGDLMTAIVEAARERRDDQYRTRVAEQVRSAISDSGLTAALFAKHVGTSGSRLSTHASGSAVPSAAMLLRIQGEVGA